MASYIQFSVFFKFVFFNFQTLGIPSLLFLLLILYMTGLQRSPACRPLAIGRDSAAAHVGAALTRHGSCQAWLRWEAFPRTLQGLGRLLGFFVVFFSSRLSYSLYFGPNTFFLIALYFKMCPILFVVFSGEMGEH